MNDGWDKMRKIYRNLHPIRYKWEQFLEKINILDLIGATTILVSLYLVTIDYRWWLLYALGCLSYVFLLRNKKLYFGVIMNIVAIVIAICNFNRGQI